MKLISAVGNPRSPKFRERAGQSAFHVEAVPAAKRCFTQGAIGWDSFIFCDADGSRTPLPPQGRAHDVRCPASPVSAQQCTADKGEGPAAAPVWRGILVSCGPCEREHQLDLMTCPPQLLHPLPMTALRTRASRNPVVEHVGDSHGSHTA